MSIGIGGEKQLAADREFSQRVLLYHSVGCRRTGQWGALFLHVDMKLDLVPE